MTSDKDLKKLKYMYDNAVSLMPKVNDFIISQHISKSEAGMLYYLLWHHYKNKNKSLGEFIEMAFDEKNEGDHDK